MSNYKNIKIDELSDTIQKMLNSNAGKITSRIKDLSKDSAQELTKLTKRDAPVKTKEFKKHISCKLTRENSTSAVYTWYVKSPEYRLTHLIAKGHDLYVGAEKKNKIPKKIGRAKGNDFLEKNLVVIQNKFEEGVKNIIKDEL